MARISVDEALKVVPNRFGLVHVVARRAKQLLSGAPVLGKQTKENKAIVTAIREVEDNLVRFMTEAEIKAKRDAELAEEAAAAAAQAEAATPAPVAPAAPEQPAA